MYMTDEECFQVSFTLAKMLYWFEKKEWGRVKACFFFQISSWKSKSLFFFQISSY